MGAGVETNRVGARPIPSPHTHPLTMSQPAKRRDYPRRLLLRRLLFLCFLGRFSLLRLWGLVRLGDYGAVDRIDIHFVDSGLARDGDVIRIDQLSVLALELAGLYGAVGNLR